MPISIHDRVIVGYDVRCRDGEIILETDDPGAGQSSSRVSIIFTGVEAHEFRNVCPGNIIFGIEENSAESLVRLREAEFNQSFSEAGWPPFWGKAVEDVCTYLENRGVRAFEISSSYGMSGWVLAQSMEVLRD